jgi:inner membrane protein
MENQEKERLLKSNTVRLMLITVLVLVLLIPLEFVKSLITERSTRKNEVMHEVGKKHGNQVKFYGPIIKVPYKKTIDIAKTDPKTNLTSVYPSSEVKYAYFFPDTLTNISKINTDTLDRNIYKVSVFNANMSFTGSFGSLDFSKSDINPSLIQWEKATIIIKTTNLKSIKNQVFINFKNQKLLFEPIRISDNNNYEILETNFINLKENTLKDFNFKISYDGSQQLMFIPVGKSTKISMESNWKDPKFDGYFLPNNDATKLISDKGFKATWSISNINRAFSQFHYENLPNLDEYLFGVNFVIPVDEYQKNERTSKYGFLVIGLTFLIFFLIQTTSKIIINLFNYSMIGVALVLFYTLLISITEHTSFAIAYFIASIAVITLLTWYTYFILNNKKFMLLITVSLAALYKFIYVIIQLEEYALLAGSIGLFVILALVMYFTQKIEWNN